MVENGAENGREVVFWSCLLVFGKTYPLVQMENEEGEGRGEVAIA